MANLETKYMGLSLKNPIIIGSSGLTNSVEKIKELEKHGAAAVVLKSVFEEQILLEANALSTEHMGHTEEGDLLTQYIQQHTLNEYLKLIEETKKVVSIPVIASINCVSNTKWTTFAKKIEESGADALELNIFIMPADYKQKGEDVEKIYFDIINEVKTEINIPVAVKTSHYFSSMANMLFNLSVRHIDGLVLFNRFYKPDIDLKKMEVVSAHIFSNPEEMALPLQWIGILSDHAKCDLAASTGIHDGEALLKCLLVGAKAVQVVSAIYKNGPAHIEVMLDQLTQWMTEHKYNSLTDFIGKLSHDHVKQPAVFERAQFMKYYFGAEI